MRYLKPTFSKHPLNYFLLLIVFIGSFSFASMASAFEDDGSWQQGYVYWLNVSGYPSTKFPTATTAYDAMGFSSSWRLYFDGTTWRVQTPGSFGWLNKYTFTKTSCGAYADPKPSACSEEPGPVCPDFGTELRVATLLNGDVVDGAFVHADPDPVNTITIGGGTAVGGCGYARSTDPNFDNEQSVDCFKAGEGTLPACYSFEIMVATGEAMERPEGDQYAADADVLIEADGDPAATQLLNTYDSVVTPTTVEDLNGTTKTTDMTVETLVKDKGAKVVETAETAVVSESNGIFKTVTTITTQLELPDGSKEVVVETVTSYSQSPESLLVLDKKTGQTTSAVKLGSSASSKTTETTNFDSQGNEVSSSTQESGSGTGDAAEQAQTEACENDSTKCEGWTGKDTLGFDLKAMGDSQVIEWGKVEQKIADVRAEIDELFSLSSTSASLGCYPFISFEGKDYDFCPSEYASAFDQIGNALMLIVMILSAALILKGSD